MTGTEVESRMCPGFLGAAPALRAAAPSHAPHLHSYLPVQCWKSRALPFFKVAQTQRQLELEQNLLLNHGSDLDQGQRPQKELNQQMSSSDKQRPGLNMHMLVHILYTTKCRLWVYVCIWLDLSVFPLSLSLSLSPSLASAPYPVCHYISQKTRS